MWKEKVIKWLGWVVAAALAIIEVLQQVNV